MPIQALIDSALGKERQEAAFVLRPAALGLLVGSKQLLRGCEQRLVNILCLADHAEKVGQIVALGKAGELRGIVEPNVYQSSDAHSSEGFEELGCGFLGETGRIDLHATSSSWLMFGSSNSESCCAGAR